MGIDRRRINASGVATYRLHCKTDGIKQSTVAISVRVRDSVWGDSVGLCASISAARTVGACTLTIYFKGKIIEGGLS
jgi:hypothetical protein